MPVCAHDVRETTNGVACHSHDIHTCARMPGYARDNCVAALSKMLIGFVDAFSEEELKKAVRCLSWSNTFLCANRNMARKRALVCFVLCYFCMRLETPRDLCMRTPLRVYECLVMFFFVHLILFLCT
jgi:hypothetical protein